MYPFFTKKELIGSTPYLVLTYQLRVERLYPRAWHNGSLKRRGSAHP